MNIRRIRLFPESRKARVWLAVFAFAALVAGVFLIPSTPAHKTKTPSHVARGDNERLVQLNRDDDNDELKNWEEALFRTDPNNPDTDGDGVADGEEVKQGRDPAKAGPDDRLPAPTLARQKTSGEEQNLTRDFTEAILARPVVTMLAGGTPQIPQETVERYADALLKQSVLSAAPTITRSDIRIDQRETPEAIAGYFRTFQNAFEKIRSGGVNETEIALQLLRDRKYGNNFEDLKVQVALYDEAIADLKQTPAPQSLADFHVSVLNYLSQFRYSATLFQQIEQDPVKAVVALNERLELEKQFRSYLDQSQRSIVSRLQPKS